MPAAVRGLTCLANHFQDVSSDQDAFVPGKEKERQKWTTLFQMLPRYLDLLISLGNGPPRCKIRSGDLDFGKKSNMMCPNF